MDLIPKNIKIHVFENLTTDKETIFVGMVNDLEKKSFLIYQ